MVKNAIGFEKTNKMVATTAVKVTVTLEFARIILEAKRVLVIAVTTVEAQKIRYQPPFPLPPFVKMAKRPAIKLAISRIIVTTLSEDTC